MDWQYYNVVDGDGNPDSLLASEAVPSMPDALQDRFAD
jgi:hypothetical protein